MMIKSLFVVSALLAIAVAHSKRAISPPRRRCLGPNEYYLPRGIAPNCDTVCTMIGQPCIIAHLVPPSGCYCLPDNARNANNTCVPIAQCPIRCLRIRPTPIEPVKPIRPISPVDPIDLDELPVNDKDTT